MIFWLELKLEISYRVIISWRILVSFRGFFWRLYFCMVKYLSFHNSSSFALRYLLFNVNVKATILFFSFPIDKFVMDWATKKIDPWITQINYSKININYKTNQSTILVINLATKCLFNWHKANLDQQKIAFNLIPGGWNTQNQPIFVVKSGHKNSNKPKAIIQLVFAG